jgi:lambda family phage tail tape measure protein
MAFNLVVGITATGADQIDKLEQGLDDTTQAANRTTQAVKTLGAETSKAAATLKDAGNAASAGIAEASSGLDAHMQKLDAKWAAINKTVLEGGTVPKSYYSYLSDEAKAMIDSLERVAAPVQRYEQELAALDISLRKGSLSFEQYDLALAAVQKRAEKGGAIAPMQGPAFDPGKAGAGLSDELKREQQILEKINGPMREYQAQVAALDRLLQKGEVDLADYNRELERAGKAAGKGLNPAQGPKLPGAAAAGGGATAEGAGAGDYLKAIAPQLGQGGQLLSQFASGGVLAAAGAAALVIELGHLSDQYTTLSNQVERFSTSTQSADDMLHQQLDLSRELHSSLEATTALYVRVRESTNELNLSQRQQLDLARDIGITVASEGKSAEEAASLTRRLSLAFETGAVSGRELRSIMKQFPEIADGFSAALGKTRNEMLQMANKGEISAQQIIDAFHRMAPEAEKTLARMNETFSQKAGHLWDSVKLSVGGALKDYLDSYKSPYEIAEAYTARKLHEQQEAARQLNADLERNTRTAAIASAAREIGVDIGPFSKELADKITGVRMTAREAGVDIADAFENAKAKAQLYGTEIDKIKEQHAAKEIADDAKRMYDAMYGASNILETQLDKWRDIGLQITTITKAIERWRTLDAGGLPSRERTELERQKRDLLTAQDDKPFGDEVTKYAQGLDKARDGLEDWRAAAKAGTISQEELRKKTDEFLTTLNDGRLPEAIRIWEGIHLPIDQAARDFRALEALLHSGRLTLSEYVDELRKVAATGKNADAQILVDVIGNLDVRVKENRLSWTEYEATISGVDAAFQKLHKTASGVTYRIAPDFRNNEDFKREIEAMRRPPVTQGADVRAALAQVQSSTLVPGTSNEAKLLNDQLERSNQLATEFVAPATKYEQRIKDIDGALSLNSITEEQATAARRRARDTLNQETEALEAQKGPMEAYEAALRKLKDQLDAGNISQRQYTQGVDKAKLAMIEATGAAETFRGAMQIEWVKLQQEAESFGATVANLAIDDFGKLNDAIVATANGGAVSWSQMADSMIQDLERIALKMLEVKLIGSVVGLFGGIAGGGGGLADTGIGMEGWSGYATGGSFLVGGDGGVDTTPIAFRATRGERVTITPPGAYPYPSPASSGGGAVAGGGGAPVVHVHNHYDSAISQAALDGPGGQASVMNTLRLKSGALRNLTSRPRRA